MGFADFWRDLWDGGGIGKSGKPISITSANPMQAQNMLTKPKPMKMPSRRTEVNGGPIKRSQIAAKRDVGQGINFNAGPRLTPRQADHYTPPTTNPNVPGNSFTGPNLDDNFVQELMDKILGGNNYDGGFGDSFRGLEQSQAAAKKALLNALNGNLKALNGLRGNARGNFQTSDANLAAMHKAFQDDIRVNGRKEFQDITNDQIEGLEQGTEQGTNRLAQLRSQQMAERAAMLKNLGIEAAGAAKPESDILNEGIGYINKTGANSEQMARGIGAANQARNQGMATAVGNEGLERRSALKQQLDAILGQADLQEANMRNSYNTGLADLQMGFNDQTNQLRMAQMEFGQRQQANEMEQAAAMLNDIYEQRAAQAQSEAEAITERMKFDQAMEKMKAEFEQRALLNDRKFQQGIQMRQMFPEQ